VARSIIVVDVSAPTVVVVIRGVVVDAMIEESDTPPEVVVVGFAVVVTGGFVVVTPGSLVVVVVGLVVVVVGGFVVLVAVACVVVVAGGFVVVVTGGFVVVTGLVVVVVGCVGTQNCTVEIAGDGSPLLENEPVLWAGLSDVTSELVPLVTTIAEIGVVEVQ